MTNQTQPPVPQAKTQATLPDVGSRKLATAPQVTFDVQRLSIWFGTHQVLADVSMQIRSKAVTAIIGPSGCGKSTFLRSLNRMHDLVPSARIEGRVTLFGEELYAKSVDPTLVRRRVGMVFQKSNPFPTMSIAENVTVGLKLNGVKRRTVLQDRMEETLRMAALWDEVKDRFARKRAQPLRWSTTTIVHRPRAGD